MPTNIIYMFPLQDIDPTDMLLCKQDLPNRRRMCNSDHIRNNQNRIYNNPHHTPLQSWYNPMFGTHHIANNRYMNRNRHHRYSIRCKSGFHNYCCTNTYRWRYYTSGYTTWTTLNFEYWYTQHNRHFAINTHCCMMCMFCQSWYMPNMHYTPKTQPSPKTSIMISYAIYSCSFSFVIPLHIFCNTLPMHTIATCFKCSTRICVHARR